MVFNTTFNNISVISWQSVLLVEETGVSGETTDPEKRLSFFSKFEFIGEVFGRKIFYPYYLNI
jgi:hypothetical protein